jgi:glycosyltransferase involved in cell wall biosynthesis
MKRILFILHLPPPVHGASLVGQIIKSNKLINELFYTSYISLNTSSSLSDIGKFYFKKYIIYIRTLFSVISKLLIKRPDLVYITLNSHGLGFIKDSIVVLVCRLFGLPHIFHFHNKGVKKYSESWVGKIFYPFVFSKADVILLSPFLYSDIEYYVPVSRIHYCPNGIPDMGIDSRKKPNSENHVLKLLFLSNLIISKGILDLLKACYLLSIENFNFHLTIAGAEGNISSLELKENIQMHGLERSISYVGPVIGEKKKSLLQESDIFIFPTFYENECFPLVLLEAMQFGLPIISTDEGAIPEIVEDGQTGLLVAKKDAHALAEKLELLINNKELRTSMGIAGRKKYEAEFTLAHFEKRFTNILHRIS